MNKEHYYNQTDRQRLSSSQRQVMSLEHKVTELQQEIVRLTLKSDKDDSMIEQSYDTLSTLKDKSPSYEELKTIEECYDILKSCNITGKKSEIEKELSNVIKSLHHKYMGYSQSLGDDEFNPNSYMIDTLKTCHDKLTNQYITSELEELDESLIKDLGKVISFLKQ
tara:strand:+ start:165 stop:662 length:498 start_codon:yes stop_codon:yes gene_type:complete